MTAHSGSRTLNSSFSFYVEVGNQPRPIKLRQIDQASRFGDALTLAGPHGPSLSHRLRDQGLTAPLLFDGLGYRGEDLDTERWVAAQRASGADRVLLAGTYLPWTEGTPSDIAPIIHEQLRVASDLDATALFGLDVRWLAKKPEVLRALLIETAQPTALVLAHRADPLEMVGVAPNLRALVAAVPHMSILRCDHGGLVAAACGDGHASIGLTTATRHLVGFGMSSKKSPDPSPRVFVRSLLDWFKGSQLASWDAAKVPIRCQLPCCCGGSLGALYFDEDSKAAAAWHNMNAVADFADYIIGADPDDRASVFRQACDDAASRYGLAGIHGPTEAKRQLRHWVFS